MEPQVQYAKTSDGVSIAYATYGEGDPIVWAQTPVASHVQLEWQQPMLRAAFSRLVTHRRMVVRFDTRGVGLSDRDVDDLSLDARILDLEAVTDHLALNKFALVGLEDGGLAAIGYALRHPERVTHLLLVNGFANVADWRATPRGRAFMGMGDDFEMWSENVGAVVFGFGREEARRHAEFVRACVDHEMLNRLGEATYAIDLTGLLSQITTPTLVICHSSNMPMNVTRKLASSIPNARLLAIEGSYADNAEQFFGGVTDFLGVEKQIEAEGEEAEGAPSLAVEDIHTVLFTDVEGSTALTDRLGDAKARELLREHERIVRQALKAHGGSEVKTLGDGFMASFSSATKALECAIAMQRAFEERNASLRSQGSPSTDSGRTEEIRIRIGLNAGEPIAEDDPDGRGDLFGTAVNMAARIAAQASGSEILVADVVRQLVAGKKFLFADRGETELRGFEDPARVYEVRWRE